MQRRDTIAIKKIIDEMKIGIQLLGDKSLSSFVDDELSKRAICMTTITIGELVKVISDETRLTNKQFPWKAVAGMRDIAAHRYQTLRMEDVFNTVKYEYPDLINQLEKILTNE